ncbi:hypothetical protein SAMN05444161_1429 [Rhizobiales bacterium GAS191]|nr:hypothetical protein SAMN05444161_1429 [Rhizobiales bacterium GAS191]
MKGGIARPHLDTRDMATRFSRVPHPPSLRSGTFSRLFGREKEEAPWRLPPPSLPASGFAAPHPDRTRFAPRRRR